MNHANKSYQPHYAEELWQSRFNTPYIHTATILNLKQCHLPADSHDVIYPDENVIKKQSDKTYPTDLLSQIDHSENSQEKERDVYDTSRELYTTHKLYNYPTENSSFPLHRLEYAQSENVLRFKTSTNVIPQPLSSSRHATHRDIAPAYTDLYINYPWKNVQTKNKCNDLQHDYKIKQLRHENDWIVARQKEDNIVLFEPCKIMENESHDTYPFYTHNNYNNKNHNYASYEKWKDINQERYFWKMVGGRTEEEIEQLKNQRACLSRHRLSHPNGVKECKQKKKLADTHFKKEEYDLLHRELIISKETLSYLPSIFGPPPRRKTSHGFNRFTHMSELSTFGLEIEQLASFLPLRIDFIKWCNGSLRASRKLSDRTQHLMSYYDSQLNPILPYSMKPFNEVYPDVPPEVLALIQQERKERETGEKKPGIIGSSVFIPTELKKAHKVGGGRYALR